MARVGASMGITLRFWGEIHYCYRGQLYSVRFAQRRFDCRFAHVRFLPSRCFRPVKKIPLLPHTHKATSLIALMFCETMQTRM